MEANGILISILQVHVDKVLDILDHGHHGDILGSLQGLMLVLQLLNLLLKMFEVNINSGKDSLLQSLRGLFLGGSAVGGWWRICYWFGKVLLETIQLYGVVREGLSGTGPELGLGLRRVTLPYPLDIVLPHTGQ